LHKENLREQAIDDGPFERPTGCFFSQNTSMTDRINAKVELSALGGLSLRLKKPLAFDKKSWKGVEKITTHEIGALMTPIHPTMVVLASWSDVYKQVSGQAMTTVKTTNRRR
jgi:hypothetical protein